MELILDTCGFLSLIGMAEKLLTKKTLKQIEKAGTVYISACSLFEIAIKHKKGNLPVLPFKTPLELWHRAVKEFELSILPVSDEIFYKSTTLNDIHNDPFDRIIISEATFRNIAIVTYDEVFKHYDVVTMS